MLKQIKQINETLKIGDKFKITFYPQNINDDIEESKMQPTTRVAIWNSDCDFVLKPKTKAVEGEWKQFTSKLSLRTKSPILPMFFD